MGSRLEIARAVFGVLGKGEIVVVVAQQKPSLAG